MNTDVAIKKKKQLTVEQHQRIAKFMTDPIVIGMSCDIPNAYGKRSRAGRYARKLYDTVTDLRYEMEHLAYKDGHAEVATELYYPANNEPTEVSTK